MKKNLNQIVIVDFDDVLVFYAPAFYKAIRCKWQKYSLYFKNLGSLTEKQVFDRPSFLITDWLLQENFFKLEKEQQEKVIKELNKNFLNDFFKLDAYKYLKPTPFAKKTLQNKLYMDNSSIKKVYVLSRVMCPEMTKFKKNFIKRHFKNHPKIEFVTVNSNEKKSDAIKRLNVDWSLFIDDEIKNIRDVAENCDISEKEFLIPRYGYNKIPLDLSLLIHAKEGSFSYFEPFEEEKKVERL